MEQDIIATFESIDNPVVRAEGYLKVAGMIQADIPRWEAERAQAKDDLADARRRGDKIDGRRAGYDSSSAKLRLNAKKRDLIDVLSRARAAIEEAIEADGDDARAQAARATYVALAAA